MILSEVRAQLQRVTPRQAITELRDNLMDVPVILVDIRPQAQREEFGWIKGALVIERNVLEWRFDPRGEARLPIADRYDLRIIVFCQEGYTSRCVPSVPIRRSWWAINYYSFPWIVWLHIRCISWVYLMRQI